MRWAGPDERDGEPGHGPPAGTSGDVPGDAPGDAPDDAWGGAPADAPHGPPPPVEERAAGPFPTGARVAAAVAGALVAVLFTVQAGVLDASGFTLTAIGLLVVTYPVALALVLTGLVPGLAQRAVGRWSVVDFRRRGHIVAFAFLVLMLFVILGLNSVAGGLLAYERVVVHGEEDVLTGITRADIVTTLVVNAILLLVPPLVWLGVVHGLTPSAAVRRLGVKAEGAAMATGLGLAFAVLVIMTLVVVALLVTQAGVDVPDNEQALAIARALTIPAALAVAVASSVTEEVFFRGFLQPRVGLLAQAVLFAVAHLSYVNALQVVVTFVLGLGFGWLFRRTGNLWAPIAAHFAFNAIMLLTVHAAPP